MEWLFSTCNVFFESGGSFVTWGRVDTIDLCFFFFFKSFSILNSFSLLGILEGNGIIPETVEYYLMFLENVLTFIHWIYFVINKTKLCIF